MFGIGFGEMMVIAVILLLAVGPKQLPSMMKTFGKGLRELRKASSDLRAASGIDDLMRDPDLRNPLRDSPKPQPQRVELTPADHEREAPPEGVDVAHAQKLAEARSKVIAAPREPSVSEAS